MGILEAAKPVAVICTRDRVRAATFYRDTLGLRMKFEDNYAVVFNIGGIDLRVSTVPDFTAHEHTVMGSRFRTWPRPQRRCVKKV
jgi:catechol-2,3-dioxygenase